MGKRKCKSARGPQPASENVRCVKSEEGESGEVRQDESRRVGRDEEEVDVNV